VHEAALAAIGQPFVQGAAQADRRRRGGPGRRSQAYLQKFVEAEIAKWASDLKIARLQPY
jgi:hypothetical protein